MPDNFRPDLDQPDLQGAQRPMADRPGQGRATQEVAQVVGQGEQLQAHLVIGEAVTGQARAVEGILAFFDPLLGCAPGADFFAA
jgi:hypothetical protein